jgi:hypothetical protein
MGGHGAFYDQRAASAKKGARDFSRARVDFLASPTRSGELDQAMMTVSMLI